VRSFADSDVPDTDNTVPFENTTPINQHKNGKINERRAQIAQVNRSGILWSEQCCQCRINLSQYTNSPIQINKNKIPHSKDSPEVPMN